MTSESLITNIAEKLNRPVWKRESNNINHRSTYSLSIPKNHESLIELEKFLVLKKEKLQQILEK